MYQNDIFYERTDENTIIDCKSESNSLGPVTLVVLRTKIGAWTLIRRVYFRDHIFFKSSLSSIKIFQSTLPRSFTVPLLYPAFSLSLSLPSKQSNHFYFLFIFIFKAKQPYFIPTILLQSQLSLSLSLFLRNYLSPKS